MSKITFWQSVLIMGGVIVVASFNPSAETFILVILIGLTLVVLNANGKVST